MVDRIAVCALVALACSCAGTAVTIPSDVTQLAWGRSLFDGEWYDYRLVITGACSKEHCFSRGRIEWVHGTIPGDVTAIDTSSIEELESILVVKSVRFVPTHPEDETPGRFEIDALNTYTGESGRIFLVIIGPRQYEAILQPGGLPPGA